MRPNESESGSAAATLARKRQFKLLDKLAKDFGYRHDHSIPVSNLMPGLIIGGDGRRNCYVVGSEYPQQDKCDLVHDLNVLCSLDLMQLEFNDGRFPTGNIYVTADGLALVAEREKHWLQRAYDKQPMTAIQIVITIVAAIVGYIAGRLHQ